MHVLIEFANMGIGYRYVLASIIGIVVGTIVNFAGAKWIAFSSKFSGRKTR
jgi:putative flippase GtrA